MTTRARIPNDQPGVCATCGKDVPAYTGTALRLQSRLFVYHADCPIQAQATDSKRIRDFDHFRRMKAALVRKWGEKLVTGTQADYDAIMKDCAPLAKFAKVQPVRIHIGLVSAYRADAAVADVLLEWHPPQTPEPHWPNQDQKGWWAYSIIICGERVCGGNLTAPLEQRERALRLVHRLCHDRHCTHMRIDGKLVEVQL